MAIIYQLNQAGAIDMRIDLGRADVAMPQQGLQGSQISPSFQKMGRKGMTQDMGADMRGMNTGHDRKFPDDLI